MSLKKFIQRIWNGIKDLFHKLEKELKELVPVVIGVIQNIKLIEDSHLPDLITALIPGGLDDKLNEKLRAAIPKAILSLEVIAGINDIEDPNEKILAIINKIKLSNSDAKDMFYHGLASKIMEVISDGKFSWSDATAVAEWYYQHQFKTGE